MFALLPLWWSACDRIRLTRIWFLNLTDTFQESVPVFHVCFGLKIGKFYLVATGATWSVLNLAFLAASRMIVSFSTSMVWSKTSILFCCLSPQASMLQVLMRVYFRNINAWWMLRRMFQPCSVMDWVPTYIGNQSNDELEFKLEAEPEAV